MAITVDDVLNMSYRRKLAVLIALLLLLGYFYFFYFLQPALAKRSMLKENLDNLDRQIQSRQLVMKEIEQHKKDIVALEKNLKTAIAKLPEQKEIPGLLVSISEAEQSAGLEDLLFKPSDPVPKEFYKELPVDIIVRGSYHDITSFFKSVAVLPRIVNITNIDMQQAKDGNRGTSLLDAECLLKTYMFMEPEEQEPTQEGKTTDEKK